MKTALTASSLVALFILVGWLMFAAGGFRERLVSLEGRVTSLEGGTASQVVLRKRPGGSELTAVQISTDEPQADAQTQQIAATQESGAPVRARLSQEALTQASSPDTGEDEVAPSPNILANETRMLIHEAFQQDGIAPTKSSVSFPTHGFSFVSQKSDTGYLFFNVGGAEFSDSAVTTLAQLASIAKTKPASTVVISSFTDNSGAEALNTSLAKERALLVAKALRTLGAPGDLVVKPLATATPRYPNNDSIGRMKNRRVEVELR